MTTFRVDDVVRDREGNERIVVSTRTRKTIALGTEQNVELAVGMTAIREHGDALTLLRRPMRVGDALRLKIDGTAHTVTADDLDPRWPEGDWLAWRHEDGTELELRRTASSPAGKSTLQSVLDVAIASLRETGAIPTLRGTKHAHRRPVRLGDMLGNEDGSTFGPMTAEDMRVYNLNGGAAEGWAHADGTVIEQPKARALNGNESGEWKPSAPIVIGNVTGRETQSCERHSRTWYVGTPGECRDCVEAARHVPWRGSLPEWVKLIEDHAPVYATVQDVVAMLAERFCLTTGPTTTDAVARSLFETDPETIAYVRSRSGQHVALTVTRWSTDLGRSETVKCPTMGFAKRPGAVDRHMQTAWEQGIKGNATNATKAQRESTEAKLWKRAVDRVAAMHEKAGGRR